MLLYPKMSPSLAFSGSYFNEPMPVQVSREGKYDPDAEYKRRTAVEELERQNRKRDEAQRRMDRWRDEMASKRIIRQMIIDGIPEERLKDVEVFCPMVPTSRQMTSSRMESAEIEETWHGELKGGSRFQMVASYYEYADGPQIKRVAKSVKFNFENVLMGGSFGY